MKRIKTFLLFSLLAIISCQSCASQEVAVSQVNDSLNAWLEVDTRQFGSNLDYVVKMMHGSKVCVVMKGDAYGHGIRNLMPIVMDRGIDYVAITSNTEAADVRASGYQGHLMRIRTATVGEMADGIQYHIEELFGNLDLAKEADQIAQEHDTTIPFHLALNAGGMSRNGIELSDTRQRDDALAILGLKHLKVVGMMTHYPANRDTEILNQLQRFKEQSSWLIRQAHLDRSQLLLHTAATYSSMFIPETRLDMVRLGSALYHYSYPGHKALKPILSFKSRVTCINNYPKGQTVSYKRTKVLTRASRLANIPIGYANGYSKNFSNRGYMLIRGHRCPVVGNVTMNITMVDVTDYPDIQAGDEVVIYGHQGQAEISGEEIGKWSDIDLISHTLFWNAANPILAK